MSMAMARPAVHKVHAAPRYKLVIERIDAARAEQERKLRATFA